MFVLDHLSHFALTPSPPLQYRATWRGSISLDYMYCYCWHNVARGYVKSVASPTEVNMCKYCFFKKWNPRSLAAWDAWYVFAKNIQLKVLFLLECTSPATSHITCAVVHSLITESIWIFSYNFNHSLKTRLSSICSWPLSAAIKQMSHERMSA